MNIKDEIATEIWTVSRLTAYIKELLEGDMTLYNLWVRGEVSNFKKAYSGHCYFKLKDKNAVIDCVMFRSRADKVPFEIYDGIKLIARGNITVYEKGGNYQLLVEELKPEGIGELFLKFLQLKEKLEKKGYFDPSRKRPLPFLPKAVGIATSIQGAALQDMIKTIKKRSPLTSIYVSPTIVQGDDAPQSIAASIGILNRFAPVEVIIVGRGGGSFEDLNCFNHEIVAHAVYNSKKPVISGVGHETDFTICDMVADYRAETPTASASASVPRLSELVLNLQQKKNRMIRSLSSLVKNKKIHLESKNPAKVFRILENRINGYRQELDHNWEKMERLIKQYINDLKSKLELSREKLNALDPTRVLKRGYVIVRDEKSGIIISSVTRTGSGDMVRLVFHDGIVPAEITGAAMIKKV